MVHASGEEGEEDKRQAELSRQNTGGEWLEKGDQGRGGGGKTTTSV